MTDAEKREQVAKQCDAVVHLATALANIHRDYAEMFRLGRMGNLTEMVGDRTARFMELLGNVLNGMDAVDKEDDAWLNPVFEAAQKLWPQNATTAYQSLLDEPGA